jgi:hypothetical protein
MTLRYKLRTLLILLAILPPLLWIGWTKYEAWRAEQGRLREAERIAREQPAIPLQRLVGNVRIEVLEDIVIVRGRADSQSVPLPADAFPPVTVPEEPRK